MVASPGARGASGTAPGGAVRLSGVEVRDAPGGGFDLGAETLRLENLVVRGAGGIGVYVAGSASVSYGKLTAINASKVDGLRRAFGFERNARVEGGELRVVDDQAAPTGYVVKTSGAQSGTLGKIHDGVANGDAVVENGSGLAWEYGRIWWR